MTLSGAQLPNSVQVPNLKRVTVGSASDNQLIVTSRGVSAHHCALLLMADESVVIEDLGSTNGTFVNGVKFQGGATTLVSTDNVSLGPLHKLHWETVQRYLFERTTAVQQLDCITIGSGPDNHLVLPNARISRNHLKIFRQGENLLVEDLNSTNGTALNQPGNTIQQAQVTVEDILYLAGQRFPVRQLLAPLQENRQTQTVAFGGEALVIGRAPDADVRLDHPAISLHHLKVTRSAEGVHVTDLNSMNGTYVNGVRIEGSRLLLEGDELALAGYVVQLDDRGVRRLDMRQQFTLSAHNISLEVASGSESKILLDQISFCIYPGEFCGLMGTSGAGKTTLLRTALGYYRPTRGTVCVNGRNLHREYDRFRTCLGYVPQEDIMHGDLTVEQSLLYSARLRLGRDMSATEIDTLINKVLQDLGLFESNPEIRSTRISQISGGQRRRVNMAIELLVDPSIFFLDEPTSGLSSQDALDVMTMLRRLADQGKVILLTLHQPSLEAYKLMDRMIFLHKGGRMAFFGATYPDSLAYTNPELAPEALTTPDLALSALSKADPEFWQQRYIGSAEHSQYVTQRLESCTVAEAEGPVISSRKGSVWWQWWVLTCRGFRIKLQDTMNSAILLAQAPIIAGLIALTFGQDKNQVFDPKYASVTLFLLVVSSVWFGCSNAARDICGEWSIYQRERMYNLSLTAYAFSKLSIGALVCAIQCGLLLLIVVPTCRLSAPLGALYGMVLMTALCGTSLGLLVSAFASPFKKRTEIAIGTIPLLLIPIVVLAGVIKPIKEMGSGAEAVASLMVSRWSFEGLLHLEAAQHGVLEEPMLAAFLALENTISVTQSLGIMFVFFSVFLAGTMLLLKRQDII